MRRMFEEQHSNMANYIVSRISDVIKPIVINIVNDALLRLGSFNVRFLVSLHLLMLIMPFKVANPYKNYANV